MQLRKESLEIGQEVEAAERKNDMLRTVLKPLALEHCKYHKMYNADAFSKNVVKNPSFSEWNQLEAFQRSGQLAKEWDRYVPFSTLSLPPPPLPV